ncbi:hypothetical protein OUZ56_022880 [Daphnia magna]|uniref:Uncharacterized protein n=1 Tax=Daphnia magna TaxID=35525 RepID=A0ABR0AXR3_9CRUS|nr:hypothetical protein OUZ56_022880 [Daphnia magna]
MVSRLTSDQHATIEDESSELLDSRVVARRIGIALDCDAKGKLALGSNPVGPNSDDWALNKKPWRSGGFFQQLLVKWVLSKI